MERGLSILIVNYNGQRFLETCLHSCYAALQAEALPHEILLLDNGSADDSLVLLTGLAEQIPTLRVFPEAKNHGFGQANNLLAQQARYATLILLNNDTEVLSLAALARVFKAQANDAAPGADHAAAAPDLAAGSTPAPPRADYPAQSALPDPEPGSTRQPTPDRASSPAHNIYTCRLLNADRSLQKNTFHYPRLFNVKVELYLIKKPLFALYSLLFKTRLEIPDGYYSGCFLVLPRQLFLTLGGFDPHFFFYHEECDLFLRMEKQGIQKAILDDQIIHFGSGGSGISDFAFKNYYQNLARLLIKHGYGSSKAIKRLFKRGFAFRIALLRLGWRIPYSPFSHIYDANKASHQRQQRQAVIALHRETLAAILALDLSEGAEAC